MSTIVHNYLKSAKNVKISFDAGTLKITGSRINQSGFDSTWQNSEKKYYTVNVDSDSEVRIDWRVKVADPVGEAKLEASALTNEESDAVKLNVPIWPSGVKVDKPVVADYSAERGTENLSFNIPDDVDLRTAKFSLSVSPSLAGTMLKAIDDLVGYPYGCVEQTMSRFLPTIIVANTFREIDAPLDADVLKELPKMVDAGLKRLYNFQHSDGGWGWWTNDKTNPYMTAYVIYGLSLANKAGYYIDSTVFNNGIASLKQQINDGNQDNFTTRSFMIYVFTTAVNKSLNKQIYLSRIDNLLKENLNPYALSLLALSLNNIGENVRTSNVLNKLAESAVRESSFAYWGGKAWHYSWHDDKVQSTAFAVKALLLRDNNYQLVSKAVRWLLLQKQGFSWHSTQETATVLFALTDFLKHTNELKPNFNVSVYLNNVKILDKNFTKADVFNDQPSVIINGLPQKNLRHGENKLVVIKNGPGTAYISGVNEYYTTNQSNEITPVFNIKRNYYLLKPENQGDKIIYIKQKINGEIKSGDIILVKTHVETGDDGLQYFILEDMLPSGFEAIKDESRYEIKGENSQSNNYIGMRPWIWFYADKEYHDDRVSFFVTNVNEEMDFSYIIRAELPGDFNVSPAQGYLMYYPEVSGSSSPYIIKVGE